MIVLDSSFLVAYHNERDPHHDAAFAAMGELADGRWGPALLAEYVVVETVTVLAFRRGLAKAVEAWDSLMAARELEFVPGSDLFLDAYARFKDQRSTKLSLTDAALVVLAQRRGASHIATFDEDLRRIRGLRPVPA